jgi:hypothetical protein
MKMLLECSYYLFSMVDFKTICNFNALLKARTKNIVFFLLFFQKTRNPTNFKGLYNMQIKKNS